MICVCVCVCGYVRACVRACACMCVYVHASEMGSDLYGRAKGIAMSDLITTVTPEKKVEERKAEEEVEVEVQVEEEDETTKATEMSQPSPTSPIRHDTKV